MDVTGASQGLGEPRLLETIDKLVELHIGDTVSLPQLLVVGDQSSGKSSVLEGVTGLPFPRNSVLCTRFATQITFRRNQSSNINVSIIPSKDASQEDAERLKKWRKSGLTSLDREEFARIFTEVHQVMDIRGEGSSANKSFSDDVLKIEVSGPDQQHLSVIDVPGIFRKVTEGVTTKDDIANVRAMVQRYMDNPRSVILAVISANVDIANQEILDMAQRYDPDGQRTLGVLTKPDLVDRGAEGPVLALVQGTAHKLTLGWSMVKNPSQEDLDFGEAFDRHASEKTFFKTKAPWSTLDGDRVGIRSLRLRLVDLLTAIVRKEFGHVRADVNQSLKAYEKTLKALGPSRETKEQQRRYLLNLATRFQAMTIQAIEAQYSGDDAFDSEPSLRLATAVVNRNESFSNDVWHKGHTMEFKQETVSPEAMPEIEVPVCEDLSKESERHDTRYSTNPEDLDDLLYSEPIPPTPETGIIDWLHAVYKEARGFEIGTFNASLVPIMWKKQSSKWENVALGYTSDIVTITHNYICDLLREICEDDRIILNLVSVMMNTLTERYKRAIDQTYFLLQVERDPLTLNHYFADNMAKCNQRRMEEQLQRKAKYDKDYHCEIVMLSDLKNNISTMSNVQHTVQTLHDILKSYYKVARKRFVDNVCMQAADRHLIRGPDAAVKVFSPSFVSDLTEEQLERIAGEDVSTKRKRADLTRQVENLKKAKELLLV
ncbi:MAG: hypothetical protein Q9208_005087 [Pyrenodesmia sp. 3 TL-2023]